jgi:DNA-binding beta-propeller fold protein YncE
MDQPPRRRAMVVLYGAWQEIERRFGRRTWRRWGIAALCAAVIAAAAVAAPGLWRSGSGPAAGHRHPRPARQLVIVSRTHLEPAITRLAAGYGGVWVVGFGVIYRVDPATGKKMAAIPAPGVVEGLSGISAGAGAVWVTAAASHDGVYRIDPRRDRVAAFIRLPPTPTGITVAYGRVWVVEPKAGPGVVVRIDPRTNRVSGPPIGVGTGPGGAVPGFGALWVSGFSVVGSVSQINPATGAVTRTLVNIPDIAAVVAAGAGSLWVTLVHGGLWRVDPATGKVTAAIRLPNAVAVTFWAGSAWVSTEPPGPLVRVDPASNRIIGKPAPAGISPAYITASPTGLWVVDGTTGNLLHLALATRQQAPQ